MEKELLCVLRGHIFFAKLEFSILRTIERISIVVTLKRAFASAFIVSTIKTLDRNEQNTQCNNLAGLQISNALSTFNHNNKRANVNITLQKALTYGRVALVK